MPNRPKKPVIIPLTEDVDSLYFLELPPFNQDPLIGIGAGAYSFPMFQSLPLLDMIGGPGGEIGVPRRWFNPLEQGLVALNPIGAPQDVVGVPVGEIDIFEQPTYLPEQETEF
jgi:hypothetical protein